MEDETLSHRSGGYSTDGLWLKHGDPNSLASRLVKRMCVRRRYVRESPADFVVALSKWRFSSEATKILGVWTLQQMSNMPMKDDWSCLNPGTPAAEAVKRCGKPSNDTCTWAEDGLWTEKPWAKSS